MYISCLSALHSPSKSATQWNLTEQRKQRDDIGVCSCRKKASAIHGRKKRFIWLRPLRNCEIKDVQGNVSHVEEKLADTRSRLRDVEDDHRKIEESLRSEARKSIEQIKNHVVKQKRRLNVALQSRHDWTYCPRASRVDGLRLGRCTKRGLVDCRAIKCRTSLLPQHYPDGTQSSASRRADPDIAPLLLFFACSWRVLGSHTYPLGVY